MAGLILTLEEHEREVPGFCDQFLDLPLEVRRDAWEWFSQRAMRDDKSPTVRLLLDTSLWRSSVCCPWGAILVSLNIEAAQLAKTLRPDSHSIPERVSEYSGGKYTITKGFDPIEHFTHLADNDLLTEDQVHRLMVPEDFA